MLLDAELRSRLDRLALRGKRRLRGVWSGSHRSVRLGESLDFADYREYHPGDDFRRIDYNLWARLGVVLIRLFEAEDEMPLQVVVDNSASMGFGDKFPTAQRTAAMVAYLGLASGERVRLVGVPGPDRAVAAGALGAPRLRLAPARSAGSSSSNREGGTDLPGAARLLAAPGAHRGPGGPGQRSARPRLGDRPRRARCPRRRSRDARPRSRRARNRPCRVTSPCVTPRPRRRCGCR